MIGWSFPSNNSGQITGLNDAGIETFLGDTITSLAREINQNSLDAYDHDARRPVEVHFHLEELDADLFPNRPQFIRVLESCRVRWNGNEKAREFFDKALEVIGREKISVLKISDYYTTGLTGSTNLIDGNWVNLTKSVGASNKDPGAGGSFGIGKHATFACSPLRAVFYGTKDNEGNEAFQGVAKLVTHVNENGETTQGTGYYGLTDKNSPILGLDGLPDFFQRDLVGTDIYIFGFDATDGWKEKIIRSVVENFFVAIHEEKLIVRVGEEPINSSTIGDLVAKYFENQPFSNCASFFEAFTSNDSEFAYEDDFEGMGRIELHILPKQHFPKRVAMVRNTGMLVFEKGHFQTPMKFAGVLRATGEGINAFLRSLEPPSHNLWQPSRHKNPQYADKVIRSLYRWINDHVRQISNQAQEEEYDFEGMQQFLPDDLEDNPTQQDTESQENTIPSTVELAIRPPKRATQPAEPASGDEAGSDEGDGTQLGGDEGDNQNTGGSVGGTDDGGSGEPGGGAITNDNTPNSVPTRSSVHLKKVRAFCSNANEGLYKIIFEPEKSSKGYLSLSVVGEVEQVFAPVLSATLNGDALSVGAKGEIGPFSFVAGVKNELEVVLGGKLHCALEVAAYENQ